MLRENTLIINNDRRMKLQKPIVDLVADIIRRKIINGESNKKFVIASMAYSAPEIKIPKPKEKISDYGIIKGKKISNSLYKIEDLIEKPSIEEAPSNLAIPGRYILTPRIFECIEKVSVGRENEIQLTDALKLLLKNEDIYGYKFKGKRYDIGDKFGYIKAIIDFALEREKLRDRVREYLDSL